MTINKLLGYKTVSANKDMEIFWTFLALGSCTYSGGSKSKRHSKSEHFRGLIFNCAVFKWSGLTTYIKQDGLPPFDAILNGRVFGFGMAFKNRTILHYNVVQSSKIRMCLEFEPLLKFFWIFTHLDIWFNFACKAQPFESPLNAFVPSQRGFKVLRF